MVARSSEYRHINILADVLVLVQLLGRDEYGITDWQQGYRTHAGLFDVDSSWLIMNRGLFHDGQLVIDISVSDDITDC